MNANLRNLGTAVCSLVAVLLAYSLAIAADESMRATDISPPSLPRVFLLDARQLTEARDSLRTGKTNLVPALAALEREAQAAMKRGPFSVVNKEQTPPSGDKHDYLSLAPYFWPDPGKTNGLPYIRRDGERNPTSRTPDRRALGDLIENVETVSLAWYFTGNEAYAAKASQLLRVWFLDEATRMNSNFQYAQGVPGVNTGRGIGLIESAGLTAVVDAVGLLAESKAWTGTDQRSLEMWFSQFLRWMQESRYGRDEAAAKNNHGTYYDIQIASFGLFIGRRDVVTNVLRAAGMKRIARQVEPDGRQPLELSRTKAWGYSTMNLRGLMSLATLGDHVGVDLWHFETPDGRSISKALDYLARFASGEKKWPHQQLGGWTPDGLFPLLHRAALQYPRSKYVALALQAPPLPAASRDRLLQPRLPREDEVTIGAGKSNSAKALEKVTAQP